MIHFPLRPLPRPQLIRSGFLLPILVCFLGVACAASNHPTEPGDLGRSAGSASLLAVIDQLGLVAYETVKAADWVVARSGLINLDHPNAISAGLDDGDEPIQIYFHVCDTRISACSSWIVG